MKNRIKELRDFYIMNLYSTLYPTTEESTSFSSPTEHMKKSDHILSHKGVTIKPKAGNYADHVL